MTQFEEIGVDRQISASTKAEAIRAFEISCSCCSRKGFKIECGKCCIANVHSDTLAYLDNYQHVKA